MKSIKKINMSNKISVRILFLAFLYSITICLYAKNKKDSTDLFDTIYTNKNSNGMKFEIILEKGIAHNHPTFAIWIEDLEGNYIQPIMVTKFIATGIFGHGPVNDSAWGIKPGEAYRPAALPYWNHKRIGQPVLIKLMPGKNDSIPDAYTSATPPGNFILETGTNEVLNNKFRLVFEINQTWDWNEYWTNNKFPDDKQYKTSCQPSVVYSVIIDPESDIKEYWLNPIGHGHYSGKDGILYTNLSTLTTAMNIVKSVKVIVKKL